MHVDLPLVGHERPSSGGLDKDHTEICIQRLRAG